MFLCIVSSFLAELARVDAVSPAPVLQGFADKFDVFLDFLAQAAHPRTDNLYIVRAQVLR